MIIWLPLFFDRPASLNDIYSLTLILLEENENVKYEMNDPSAI